MAGAGFDYIVIFDGKFCYEKSKLFCSVGKSTDAGWGGGLLSYSDKITT